MAVAPKLTYADLLEMPDDGKRYELLDGELIVSPSPIPRHQRVSAQLARLLMRAEDAGFGQLYYAPIDIVLDDRSVVVPDLIFVTTERLSIVTSTNVQGPPDLVVEILSPSTQKRDLGAKLQMYAHFGVPHYWVPGPEAEVVRRFELRDQTYIELPVLKGDDILSSPLFPGIEIAVSRLFA